MPQRFELLSRWVEHELGLQPVDIRPASSDASFRRYFRVTLASGETRIVMDAPPPQEDCRPFLQVASLMEGLGVHVPHVFHADVERGLLLLSDLGNRQYLAELREDTVEALYGDALNALLRLQRGGPRQPGPLPPYDRELLLREMALFRDWFLMRQLEAPLSGDEKQALEHQFGLLAESALQQPQVLVHRDYHSRNLMVTTDANPGVLDFQDAVIGPATYDLVSLLRDCYISWPRPRVEAWACAYLRRAQAAGQFGGIDTGTWLRWFDWMGVQRHLKAIGIFARLNLRDSKPGYLKDIPRTLQYVTEVTSRYPQLHPLGALIAARVLPVLGKLGAS